ncbi:dTDP-4-dehydrorhamnose 3,5-epimerase [Brachyspira hyodysenteriae]|uniref:dTDP-4-dehydrorhamnose 3,5-epimerase n=1 Tax=Brachyspira hyodysenteriae TaxID=159 RepID=UPI00063DB2FA|nr:dTDP-4-dehydrorhamnose 3,5-epimerase [Brachyspira hyodysenteriae]KLI21935.1 dTDP-4-dehydrorhamnose 3,5-epimerase [Brachyspira hyodysenteriae]
MKITNTNIEGAYLLQNNYIEDERGYFLRIFDNKELEKHNLNFNLIQSNINYNKKTGTLRGMHYQKEPYPEIKIVRCIKGCIFDVIIDIRKNSSTYGQKFCIELSEENNNMLYIPPYVAHGFQTLKDDTIVSYFLSSEFIPEAYGHIIYNDPYFNIDWPYKNNITISDKDKNAPYFTL